MRGWPDRLDTPGTAADHNDVSALVGAHRKATNDAAAKIASVREVTDSLVVREGAVGAEPLA